MKNMYALVAISIFMSYRLCQAEGFGYIEQVENNDPNSTLYMHSTDKTPGVYTQNGIQFDGWDTAIIPAGQSITSINNYIIPYKNNGGMIYLWLKDSNGNIINAATIQEVDGYITFAGDNQLHSPNILLIKDAMIENAMVTQCSRTSDSAPLVCKWLRQNTNQQFTITVDDDGTIILIRYSETPVSKKCALGDISCAFKTVGTFLQDTGNKIGDAFKNFGGDMNKGFDTLGTCMEVATLGTELTAKMAAKETFLSGKLTDATLIAAQETAIQPLLAARKAAEQVLEAAKQFLEKAGKPIATGSIDAARQTASATLKAGETASVAVLTATDQATQALLEGILQTFNIEQMRYEGNLQKLASGNLGNVQCKAVVAKQKIDFNFDLTIKDPISSIQKLANTIANKIVDLAQKSAQKIAGIVHISALAPHDDILKLTLWHHARQHLPLEFESYTKETV